LLRLRDFNGNILAKERMNIIEFTSGISKTFESSPLGMVVLKGPFGSVFEINFKHDRHYLTIDTEGDR
jgi:hypothetical protein